MKQMFEKIRQMKAAIFIALMAPSIALAQFNPGFNDSFSTQNAQSLGQVATNVNTSLVGIRGLIEGGAYVFALAFVVLGIFKFRAYRDDPRQTPLATPIVIWVCAALFAFAPTLITSIGGTIWGGNATSVRAPSASPL